MRINELKIYTQNLAGQLDFYTNTIGLDPVETSETQAVFQVGASTLCLEESPRFHPYHFAINIPCNRENEALQWLKQRVEILKDGEHEIQDFDFWNAKAMYFYDADRNIVEFIARKNLKNEDAASFGVHSLLEISEIGLPVNNVETAYQTLENASGIPIFDGGFERFCAIGDEHGLFICINKQVKDWFPTGDKAHASEFEIRFEEQGRTVTLEFAAEEIRAL